MRKVIIHYHRDDQDYERWGVWLWPEGYGGRWVDFVEADYFGRIATCQVAKGHRVGFVIRGASWEKDIDQDRYIETFKGDVAEVWLVSGDPTVYLAPPAHLRKDIRVFEELRVTFHYYRHDGNYTGWNVWIWGGQESGRRLQFVGNDSFGQVARTILKQQTDGGQLGFIVRKSLLGESWLARDGSQDRYIPLYEASDDGTLDVWLMQDDPQIYYNEADVDRTPRLLRASLEDAQTIRVETYLPVEPSQGQDWGFSLVSQGKSGEKAAAIEEVRPCYTQGPSPRLLLIGTKDPLDLHKEYLLRHVTHGQIRVTFGGVFSTDAFHREFHYSGNDLGVTYSQNETTFKVWAPTASQMQVVVYPRHDQVQGKCTPLQLGEKGVWYCTIKGDLEGQYYNFLVTHGDETCEVVDPYARAVGVNGLRGQIVDLQKTNPQGWEELPRLELASPTDAVIYEAHVRDFSSAPNSGIQRKGQYLGFVEAGTKSPAGISTGLDHLRELGITHVHFLPVFDFATVDEENPKASYNWGYDPLNFNVPEGSYSSDPRDGRVRIRELKTMIQALRLVGIGSIMDVVYNHSFHSVGSSFNELVPGYYYRHHRDGSFSNGSGCGNELADERSMVRKFIVDSVTYWAQEYKFAGFRFDLMGLHHIQTMQAVRRALDLVHPQILIYGEGWGAAASTLPERERALKENTVYMPGVASFCNDVRDGIKGHVFRTGEGGFIQGQGNEETLKFGIVGAVQHPQIDYSSILYSRGPWAGLPAQSVVYAEAHDNLTLWDKLLCTTPPGAMEERLKMMKLAHAILLTSQGIPFIHAGQEFARTKGGDPNSYQSPDHVNQLDWDRKGELLELFVYTKKLIELRRARPAFRLRSGGDVVSYLRFFPVPQANVVGYVLGPHAGGDCIERIVVLFNSNPAPVQVRIPEARPGEVWNVLADGEDVGDLRCVQGPEVWVEGISPLILGSREAVHEEVGGVTN